jgi:hypothetical protein
MPDNPCLSLAIARSTAADPEHFAIWVWQAPYPGGFVHHDRLWSQSLTQIWQAWQNFFPSRSVPNNALAQQLFEFPPLPELTPQVTAPPTPGQLTPYSTRLMQGLGVSLWQWVFDGSIQSSFDQSQGIARGQSRPLRLRLDIRDPDLIALPWEIMQPQPGRQTVSLSQQLLFSRTTSDVDPLPPLRSDQDLKILLVLGQDEVGEHDPSLLPQEKLALETEAAALSKVLETAAEIDPFSGTASCQVKTLLQPTPAELTQALETGKFNVLFYSGHGAPASDGGLLFLRPDAAINGTELAQVLVRCQVKLAVFNACWGALPDQRNQQTIPRSSLAEVLIHHGVPAVLAMRDTITDQEALNFIQAFAQALAHRSPIDEAVAIARQHLLMLFKFNHPAWTLPILYMHPEFNGELIRPFTEGVTEIPDQNASWLGRQTPQAYLRSVVPPNQTWSLRGGMMRVGRGEGNDVVLQHIGVSREHAEIFCRNSSDEAEEPIYLLRDRSRYGTWILSGDGWRKVHHEEILLQSRTQMKFGNPRSQALEFVIEGAI